MKMRTIGVRKMLGVVLLFAAAANAWPQGQVAFYNGLCLSSPPDRLVRFAPGVPNPFGTNNAPLAGTNFFAQLYYGSTDTPEDGLTPISLLPTTFRPTTTTNPGLWLLSTVQFPQYNVGDWVNLQVRVWDSTFGSSFEQVGSNGLQGKSKVFLHSFGLPVPFPCWDAMFNFEGFTVNYVPEPTGCALFGVGMVFIWLVRKRALPPP